MFSPFGKSTHRHSLGMESTCSRQYSNLSLEEQPPTTAKSAPTVEMEHLEAPQSQPNGRHKNEDAQNCNVNSLPGTGCSKRGRKRKFPNQSRADRKRRLNTNCSYINTKGVEVQARKFDSNFKCKCPKDCTKFVSLDERQKIFEKFWGIGTFEGRCSLINSSVTEVSKKRCYTKRPSKRQKTRIYCINGKSVCKVAFLKTLQINQSRIDICLAKRDSGTLTDQRGKSSGGWNALPETKLKKKVLQINGELETQKIDVPKDVEISKEDVAMQQPTCPAKPKRGRKRKIPNQSRADRKHRLNTNCSYINSKGVEVQARKFDLSFKCKCPKECTKFVSLSERQKIFNKFWGIGTFEGRCALINSCVTEVAKKRCYTKKPSKRQKTRKYCINGKSVCKVAFLKTLQINQSRIDICLSKRDSETLADQRGKSSGGWNALPELKLKEVIEHINSFPRYASGHYCQRQSESDANYLSPELNLMKMYDLYKTAYREPVSLSYYKRVFHEDFNLRFKLPKKDACQTCDAYDALCKSVDGEELQTLVDNQQLWIGFD